MDTPLANYGFRWGLQWGRANEGAEIFAVHSCLSTSAPLQWGRANEGAEIPQRVLHRPRLLLLQWGRANEGAEIRKLSRDITGLKNLQWGRANEGAEMPWAMGTGATPPSAFNGAAPMKARKFFTGAILLLIMNSLQWGRANEGAEIRLITLVSG